MPDCLGNQGVLTSNSIQRGNLVMNKVVKIGLGLAAGAAVVFAAGCADHAPAYQCGRVDYKSMSSCKAMATTPVVVKRYRRVPVVVQQ